MKRAAANGFAQRFQQLPPRFLGRVGQQHDELLAAEAGDEVGLAQPLLQLRANDLEHPVAGQMTVSIIDPLEVIDIQHGQ